MTVWTPATGASCRAPTYLVVRCSTIGRSRPRTDDLNKQDSATSSRGLATFWWISSRIRAGSALSTLFIEPELHPDSMLVRSERITADSSPTVILLTVRGE